MSNIGKNFNYLEVFYFSSRVQGCALARLCCTFGWFPPPGEYLKPKTSISTIGLNFSASLQFTMGAFYSFGNMTTYLTSYMRHNSQPDIIYDDFVVVQSVWGMTQGVVMPFSGFLIRAIGEKVNDLRSDVRTTLSYLPSLQYTNIIALTSPY